MVMYPTVTMPADDFHQTLPSVSEVLTSMASGVIVSESEMIYTSAEDIMDISSAYTTSVVHNTTQHAIPTSVITPTTSLANGWLDGQTNNLHGGFVPPPVSSSSGVYAIPTSAIRSVPQHQQRIIAGTPARITKEDFDLLRMSPSNSRRRIRDDEQLAPEERVKRKQRRERNKLAAAKCRQRRVDHTNALVEETEEWEAKNSTLEQELTKLQQQKEQLEFILEAHKAMCKKSKMNKETTTTASTATSTTKTVTLQTPSTEVVTPTSAFKTEPFGDSMTSPSCGRQIKRESSSDLSSPETSRTMIEL